MLKKQKFHAAVLRRVFRITATMLVFMLTAGVGTYMTVHLLIRSENKVIVPMLVGKQVVYALETLTDLGLNTKVKELRFDPSVAKNHIIAQLPEPGTEIKRGRDVRLVISRGARTVVYPNLAGIDLPQAQILLEQNGLQQANVSLVHHPSRPKQTIVTQYPSAGSRGLRGDAIDLLVSEGPAPVSICMLDLRGLGLDQAIAAIEKDRLILGNVTTVIDPAITDDTVTRQVPEAGHRVDAGTLVDITISRQVQKRAGFSSRNANFFRYRVMQGFLKQHVRVRINRPGASFDLFNEFVRPDNEIWLLVPKDVPTTLFLYLDGVLAKTEHYD
jgi:serine/threonine-protein kinase